jgi:hypothetical protein
VVVLAFGVLVVVDGLFVCGDLGVGEVREPDGLIDLLVDDHLEGLGDGAGLGGVGGADLLEVGGVGEVVPSGRRGGDVEVLETIVVVAEAEGGDDVAEEVWGSPCLSREALRDEGDGVWNGGWGLRESRRRNRSRR